MVFEYTVKYNGVIYPAGTDVPMDKPKVKEPKVEEPKAEKPVEDNKPEAEVKKSKRNPKAK